MDEVNNSIEYRQIALNELEANSGQIPGVHKNPRCISDKNFKKLKHSIQVLPSMLKAKPLSVYRHNDKYVVIGGNQRLKAMQELGYEKAWCAVYPESTTSEDLEKIMLTDNASFGEWLSYELLDFNVDFDFGLIGLDLENNEVDESSFDKEFGKYNDNNCVYPIVPKFDERHEVFIIVSDSEIDSTWLREKLNMAKMKSYKSSTVSKSNIISLKDLKDVM